MISQQAQAQAQFLTWVRKRFPELYFAAVDVADENGLSGLGAEGDSWWQRASGALLGLGTTYLALKNQRDAMRLNLARAEQGLPPVDVSATAPVIRTEIDLPPDVINKLTTGAGTQVNKILLFGGVALLAVMLLMQRKK